MERRWKKRAFCSRKKLLFLFASMTLIYLFGESLFFYDRGNMENVVLQLLPVTIYLHENTGKTEGLDGGRGAHDFSGTGEDRSEAEKKSEKTETDGGKIRVLLKTQGFQFIYHQDIDITSAAPFFVSLNGKKTRYASKEHVRFHAEEWTGRKCVWKVFPEDGGRLKVCSMKRMGRYPVYRGMFEIRSEKEGLLFINVLPFEEYLYAVVSSEMSTSAPVEALKAQAVCARTYAENKRRVSEYEKYGANIDDSDACQVYNNLPEDVHSRKAVRETEGYVLRMNGESIPVYYFSTSWGYTASGKEVWNTDEQIPYLKRRFQITEACRNKMGEQQPDLSDEKEFRSFMDSGALSGKSDSTVYETYDSSSPWYRWNIHIPWSTLTDRIEAKVKACYDAYPNLVLFQNSVNGRFYHGTYQKLGTLQRILVGARDKSGLVGELILTGSKHTVKVKTQYSIRKLLNLSEYEISLSNGKKHASMALLPSAAFYLEKKGSGADAYLLICGGGFGHGTGMSQWGARVQAEEGWSYQRILKHYFSGIDIVKGR